MNGVNSSGPYFPFHRDETYPRTLCVNFKRLEYRTLQRYCKLHGINVRPDCTQPELAVAAARHFQEAPAVDEEGVMTAFLKGVVDPERPYRPSIDLAAAAAAATMGRSFAASGPTGASGVGDGVGGETRRPGAMGEGGDSSDGDDDDYDNHGYDEYDDCDDGDYDEADEGGGFHPGGEIDRDAREYRYGPRGGRRASFDEKSRVDGYAGRGMGGGGRDAGVGGDYEHDSEYGRQSLPPQHQQHRMSAWEGGGHQGGDVMRKRRPGGSRARPPRGSGSGSAPTHGGSSAMTGRDVGLSGGGGGGEDGSGNGSGNGSGSGKMGRKLKGGGGAGDANVKPAPAKRKKGGGGWRGSESTLERTNNKRVTTRPEARSLPPTKTLETRESRATPAAHKGSTAKTKLKDDDDKEGGMEVLTAPRNLVIRLEDNTKGVQRGDRVLAVFPDTTSFYLGVVHKVPKTSVGAERRIEVKFKDDADDNGRTPARPLPARYVVPLPDGYEETDEGKSGGPDGAGTAVGGGGIAGTGMAGGGREVDHDAPEDAIGTEEEDGDGPSYVEMIRTALLKLPGRQGNLPMVCNYIEEHFHDRLNWKSESSLRRTPAWKTEVRRILAHHSNFCHAGTPERNVYTLAE